MHLPILGKLPRVSVVGILDSNQSRSLILANRYCISHVCRSLDEFLSLGLDGALIACPNYLHASMSLAALEAGINVMCEKPMATTIADAEAMIRAAEAKNTVLTICFPNRQRHEIVALQQMIAHGQLGEVYALHCGWLRQDGIPGIGSWFTSREHAGGGALIDLGSHLIDLALWLSGRSRLLEVSCVVGSTYHQPTGSSWYIPASTNDNCTCDVELSASAFAVLDGPLNVSLEVSWACSIPNDQTYLHILGSRGIAHLETVFGLSPSGNRPEYPLQVWTDGDRVPLRPVASLDLLQPYRDCWISSTLR